MPEKVESTKHLKIIFGGASHEIDADVLIESLVNYSLVAQEASFYLSPDSKVNIKIKATKEGSFELIHDFVAFAGNNLFTGDHLQYAAALVTVVGGLYGLRRWLAKNGEQEVVQRNGSNVKIKNNNGEITINNNVFQIYQSSDKVRDALKKTFVKLKDANEIDDFKIIDQDEKREIFKVEKEDFALMASDKGETEKKKQKEVRADQEFSVFKVVFKEDYKWEFFYQGNRIYASITDRVFLDKVGKGEVAFRSGDRMVADLEIIQVFNEAANVFVNEDYLITNVKKHIPRTIQNQESFKFIKEGDES